MASNAQNTSTSKLPRSLPIFLLKLWGPAAWLLEAGLILNLALNRPFDAAAIALLLFAQAALSFHEDYSIGRALDRLRGRMRSAFGVEAEVNLPERPPERQPKTLPRFARAIASWLGITGGAFSIAILVYLLVHRLPPAGMLTFALVLLAASIPWDRFGPTMLPGALAWILSQGAQELAGDGVFVTRLSALEDLARMQVLCVEKTGSLTENHPTIAAVLPYAPYTREDVLRLAAMASSAAANASAPEPLSGAILKQAETAGALPDFANQIAYHPLDPMTKHSEAVYETDGETLRVMVGLPEMLFSLSGGRTPDAEALRLSAAGYQVQVVAVGDDTHMQIAGLVAFDDPLRADAPVLIQALHEQGVKIVIFTGEGIKAAQAAAQKIGLESSTYSARALRATAPAHPAPFPCPSEDGVVYADMLPEDTARLVRMYQQSGCITGLATGSGQDVPALRQAEVGIATARAAGAAGSAITADEARPAAGFILTSAGLSGIYHALLSSRRMHQQMLACSLYTIVIIGMLQSFLGLGTLITGAPVITPIEFVFLLIITDLTAAALRGEKVTPARRPVRGSLWKLAWMVFCLVVPILLLSCGVSWAGASLLHLDSPQLQTLEFAALVFIGQGLAYLVRERRPAWQSIPGKRLLLGTLIVLLGVSLVVVRGMLVSAIPFRIVLGLFVVILACLIALDVLKVRLLLWLDIE